jgi:flotillin
MDFITLIPIAVVVIVLLIILIIFFSSYKAPLPNEALIVSGAALGSKNVHKDGSGNKVKIVRGSGTFVLPGLQRSAELSMEQMPLEVLVKNVYNKDGVPVSTNGVVVLKVGSSIEEVATAAEQFLTKKQDEIENSAREVLEGHLRAIIGTMGIQELNSNREHFGNEVQEQAATDLAKMGLVIVSFTLKDLADPNGVLDALGAPEIARIQKEAKIAQANAQKEATMAQAKADQESRISVAEAGQLAQQAELERQAQIAESEKNKELKLATFKQEQDTARAKADQAYKIQEAKSALETTKAEMDQQVEQRKRQVELEQQEVLRAAQEKEATIVAEANAQKEAQIAKAEADAKEREVRAQAEASAIEATGKAEAEAIRVKGLAEAEALEKKAEAMTKLNEAGKMQMILDVLPKIVAATADNLGKVDSINLYGGDGANTIMGLPEQNLKRSLDVLKTFGIDAPDLMGNFSKRHNAEVNVDARSKQFIQKEEVKAAASEPVAPKTE